MEAYKVIVGPSEVHPETFQVLVPVTIYLTKEVLHDLYGAFPLDLEDELVKIIGQEILNGLKNKNNG